MKWFEYTLVSFVLFFGAACGRKDRVGPTNFSPLPLGSKTRLLFNTGAPQQGRDGQVGVAFLKEGRLEFAKAPVSADAVLRIDESRKKLFVLNRFFQEGVHVLDTSSLHVLGNYSVYFSEGKRGMNAQDITLVSDTEAYLTRLESKNLARIHPITGQLYEELDLGGYAVKGQLPHMTKMRLQGDRLAVLLQRLIRVTDVKWEPSNATIAMINTASRRVETTIELKHRNPVTDFVAFGSELFLGSSDFFNSRPLRGGIARIHPENLRFQEEVIPEKDLGGNLFDFVLTEPQRGFAVVYTENYSSRLVEFNVRPAAVRVIAETRPDSPLGRLVYHPEGYLFVADRDKLKPGIRVYQVKARTPGLTELSRFGVGLPPLEMVLSE